MTEDYLSALELAAHVRAGQLSPGDVARATLAHIEAIDPRLGAVVETWPAPEPGTITGPLAGVAMTVKESIHVAGARSTWGLPDAAEHRAAHDATVVRRLRDAGAVVIGTTNVATMLADTAATTNPLYHRTANPWDFSRSPGGSSGGAAAALAAGLTYLEYGSDVAGSVRVPAALCGVYGLRPTAGTVPTTGFRPPGEASGPIDPEALSVIGPLARGAGDLRAALAVTGGPDGAAERAYRWRLAPPRRDRLADVRAGVVLDHPAAPVNADVGAALSDTIDALARAGTTIVEGWPTDVDPVDQAASFGAAVGEFFAVQTGDAGDLSADRMIEGQRRRTAARAAWDAHFADVDVVLLPVTPTSAFPDGEWSSADLGFWIAHAGLVGVPALSAPVGRTPGGLPVGVQILGPRHEDDTAITFAERLADLVGGFTPPPGIDPAEPRPDDRFRGGGSMRPVR